MGLVQQTRLKGTPTLNLSTHVVAPSIFFENMRQGKVDRTGPEKRAKAYQAIISLVRYLQESTRFSSRLDTMDVSVELFEYAMELRSGRQIEPERCAQIRDRFLKIGDLVR